MFSSNNRGGHDDLPPAPSYDAPAQTRLKASPSVIGKDITITGNVSATADLQIDGKIDGDVRCGGLSMGAEGRIKGTVIAESARLGGTIEGAVTVRNLTITSQAKILGDVAYETIAIENGAHIDGRLKYTPAGVAQPAPVREVAPAPREETVRLVSDGGAAA
jgi:cytoskeletal protein CcmA (bactofilin family)